jgi:hypothetical protein
MKILNRILYSYMAGGYLHTAEIDYSRHYSLTNIGAERVLRRDGVKFVSVHSIQTFIDER